MNYMKKEDVDEFTKFVSEFTTSRNISVGLVAKLMFRLMIKVVKNSYPNLDRNQIWQECVLLLDESLEDEGMPFIDKNGKVHSVYKEN